MSMMVEPPLAASVAGVFGPKRRPPSAGVAHSCGPHRTPTSGLLVGFAGTVSARLCREGDKAPSKSPRRVQGVNAPCERSAEDFPLPSGTCASCGCPATALPSFTYKAHSYPASWSLRWSQLALCGTVAHALCDTGAPIRRGATPNGSISTLTVGRFSRRAWSSLLSSLTLSFYMRNDGLSGGCPRSPPPGSTRPNPGRRQGLPDASNAEPLFPARAAPGRLPGRRPPRRPLRLDAALPLQRPSQAFTIVNTSEPTGRGGQPQPPRQRNTANRA